MRNFAYPPKSALSKTTSTLPSEATRCFGLFWQLSFSLIVIFFVVSTAKGADLTNYKLRLDHITYLTQNLDSLTRVFQQRGFTVTPGDSRMMDMQRHFVNFSDGTYIELQSTTSLDSTDWRVRALRQYGDHIASIAFLTDDLQQLRGQLTDAAIPMGDILEEWYEGALLWKAFGIKGIAPLDVVFIEREQDLVEIPVQHENGHRRIEWVIFATVKEQEKPLRDLFFALNLTIRHEGWFDYWMLGKPEERLSVRIGPPYKPLFTESQGVFIEENGLVFAY